MFRRATTAFFFVLSLCSFANIGKKNSDVYLGGSKFFFTTHSHILLIN